MYPYGIVVYYLLFLGKVDCFLKYNQQIKQTER